MSPWSPWLYQVAQGVPNECLQEQRRTRTRPGRQSGYDGKNKSVKILFLKAEDVIKMVLAAGGGGKST